MYRNAAQFDRYEIKQPIVFFANVNLESKTQFFTQSLCNCSLQNVLLLLHIIFKFSFHAWQVPRSSVGRALYRECGPSQDGDPVPGNLPFCIIFSFFWIFLILFFSKLRCYSHFITGQEIVCSIFVYSSSRLTTLAKVFFHLFASLPFHALLN